MTAKLAAIAQAGVHLPGAKGGGDGGEVKGGDTKVVCRGTEGAMYTTGLLNHTNSSFSSKVVLIGQNACGKNQQQC